MFPISPWKILKYVGTLGVIYFIVFTFIYNFIYGSEPDYKEVIEEYNIENNENLVYNASVIAYDDDGETDKIENIKKKGKKKFESARFIISSIGSVFVTTIISLFIVSRC